MERNIILLKQRTDKEILAKLLFHTIEKRKLVCIAYNSSRAHKAATPHCLDLQQGMDFCSFEEPDFDHSDVHVT